MVGKTLGHYRVLALLGRGGMGEVYTAEDLKLKRRVALKTLPAEMAANKERRRRFEREAQAVAALNHPGIVTIYSVEQEAGTAFLTMELVEGKTLAEAVPPGGMPADEFLPIAIQVADAVQAAHERGILHRDLKPGNVMLTAEGRIKVLDFGLAKLTDAGPPAELHGSMTTSAGQIVGTVSYMAPEQAEGKPIDHRADVFGLGVLLYELAAGVRPFQGETNLTILAGLMRDTPRPIAELRQDLAPAVGAIIQKCLEKDPAKRFQSAGDLRAKLEEVRDSQRPTLKRPAPRWAYAASAVIVLLTGLVSWWALRTPSPEASTTAYAAAEGPILVTGNSVAILDFEDRTSVPALGAWGLMLGESIATGLAARGIPVVSAMDASATDGLTITGTYFLDGDFIRFEGRVLSASRGIVLKQLAPIRIPRIALTADLAQRYVVDAVVDAQSVGRR
jgi:serine/threonine protein kinase